MELSVGRLEAPWKLARSVFTLSFCTLAKGECRERQITSPNLESVRASKLGQGEREGKKISLISKKPGGERKRNMNQVSQTESRCEMTVKTKTFRSDAAWSRLMAQGEG